MIEEGHSRMKYIIIAILLFGSSMGYAQKGFNKAQKATWANANLALEQGDYLMATQLYQELYTIKPEWGELNYKLGLCYLHLPGATDRAINYLNLAKVNEHVEALFYLGRAYHEQMNFKKASLHYRLYKDHPEKQKTVEEVDWYMSMTHNAKEAIGTPHQVNISNLGQYINTRGNELHPIIVGDRSHLYFSSRTPYAERRDLDIFFAYDLDGDWSPPQALYGGINTPQNEVVVGVTFDGHSMLFNRSASGIEMGDLYIVNYDSKGWGTPQKLSDQVNSEHAESGAGISAAGGVIYFSSNRPGGIGGKDLWRIIKMGNGEWSLPQNIGGPINTEYDEDAPFLSPYGNELYFSSNGHQSIGGTDIFKSTITKTGTWDEPVSLGYPINSTRNDRSFTINEEGTIGYFDAVKKDTEGGTDLYQVDLRSHDDLLTPVKVVYNDSTAAKNYKGVVYLCDNATGDIYGKYRPNKNGEFLLIISPDIIYSIEFKNDDDIKHQDHLSIDRKEAGHSLLKRQYFIKPEKM